MARSESVCLGLLLWLAAAVAAAATPLGTVVLASDAAVPLYENRTRLYLSAGRHPVAVCLGRAPQRVCGARDAYPLARLARDDVGASHMSCHMLSEACECVRWTLARWALGGTAATSNLNFDADRACVTFEVAPPGTVAIPFGIDLTYPVATTGALRWAAGRALDGHHRHRYPSHAPDTQVAGYIRQYCAARPRSALLRAVALECALILELDLRLL